MMVHINKDAKQYLKKRVDQTRLGPDFFIVYLQQQRSSSDSGGVHHLKKEKTQIRLKTLINRMFNIYKAPLQCTTFTK